MTDHYRNNFWDGLQQLTLILGGGCGLLDSPLYIPLLQTNLYYFQDARIAYEQRRESKNLVMQMYPPHERNFYEQ